MVASLAWLASAVLGAASAWAVPGDGVQPTPDAPEVQPASDEGRLALEGFRLPEGIKGSLTAAEPNVANIVAFDIDHQGRIYVCETFRQSRGVEDNRKHGKWLLDDLAAQSVEDRRAYILQHFPDAGKTFTRYDDRVRLLIDETGDHVVDRATVFADGFNDIVDGTGAGVLAIGPDVFYTNIPALYRLKDTTGDGQADERLVMSTGYGVRFAFRGHDMHGLIQGPDGRLYWSIGDRGYNVATLERTTLFDPASGAVFRCDLDGANLEVVHTGLRNPQELAFDNHGRLFTGDNNSDSGDKARVAQIVWGADSGWRMHYQYLPDRGPFNREKIWYPYEPHTQPEQPASILPPIANFADGPSGFCFDPGTGLTDHFRDRFFLCDFRGTPGSSGIRTFRLQPRGAGFELVDAEQSFWNILATDCAFGPDGGFYISDWVDGWEGEGKGRLYRMTPGGTKGEDRPDDANVTAEVRDTLKAGLAETEVPKLVTLLGHADRRLRQEASFELARRGEIDPLAETARDAEAPELARLHALWGLEILTARRVTRLDRPATIVEDADEHLAAVLTALATDDEPAIRRTVMTILGDQLIEGGDDLIAAGMRDEDASVAAEACLAASRNRATDQLSVALAVLEKNADVDATLRHAAIMAITTAPESDEELVRVGRATGIAGRRGVVVALGRRLSPRIASFLTDGDPWIVTEAARAIHDRPINDALDALAKLNLTGGEPEPLVRRWLNAQYRLGTSDQATRLVEAAGRGTFSEAMRVEALAMLAAWEKPEPLDRVLGDFRPLETRSAETARTAVLAGLATLFDGSEQVSTAVTETATKLGIREIIPVLTKTLDTADAPASLRASALTALDRLDADGIEAKAASALDADTPALSVAAIRVLARRQGDKALDRIEAMTSASTSAERQAAIESLALVGSEAAANVWTETAQAIMDRGNRQDDDDAPSPEIWLELSAAAKTLGDKLKPEPRTAWEKFVASQPGEAYAASLVGGDADRGRAIFFGRTELSCVRCHKADGQGGEVGPDLSSIGAVKPRLYLLESITEPNKAIAEGFQSVIVLTEDGRTLTGVLRSETDETLTLVTPEGAVLEVPQDTIEGMKQTKSAMPEDLIKLISPTDLRDLVEYLSSQQAADR